MSRAPEFDKGLDRILGELKPHSRTCVQKDTSPHCMGEFQIFKEDIDFYGMLRIPPPKLCPECRSQRRLAWLPNVLKFYKKEDSATGEKIISSFHPKSSYKIYGNKYHFDTAAWDAIDYGRNYDSGRSFFEQFHDLLLDTPHLALPRYGGKVINSEYTVSSLNLKDCYVSSTLGWTENVNYSIWALRSKDCFDCLGIDNSEQCYENVVNNKCANCKYAQQCFDCLDCILCYDCRNCQNCFGCTNLRSKQYCFFNEQLTKGEYEKRMMEINLGNREVLRRYSEKFEEQKKAALRLAAYQKRCENSVGHQIGLCKNCYHCFWILEGENIRWSSDAFRMKDSMDVSVVGPGERAYNHVELAGTYNTKCCFLTGESRSLEYCVECFDCSDCFGCVGLKKKKFCILNKQYEEADYWQLVDKIKGDLLRRGEYGEFMPLKYSLYAYADSFASVIHPLSYDEIEEMAAVSFPEELGGDYENAVEAKDLPGDIKDVGNDVLEKAIICEVTGRPFRIIKKELDFYRKHDIPLPTKHPQVRVRERFLKRNPLKLWPRRCMCFTAEAAGHENTREHFHGDKPCPNEFETSYAPDRKEIVYCEECYNAEVV